MKPAPTPALAPGKDVKITPDQIVGIGSSAVFGQWGYFTDRIGQGTCWVITYNREHGRDRGRSVSSEPRCVALRPDIYNALAARMPNHVPVEEVGSYQGRQKMSRYSIRVLQGAREGNPLHYRIMHKKQGASQRTRIIKGEPVVQHLPASPGTPVAVLVSLPWFAERSGYDTAQLAVLNPSETPASAASA